MQVMVLVFGRLMQRTLGTTGAESLAAAANIFLGQTEAPLVVRPYIATMTRIELMAVMVPGFGSTAGGVLAAYVSMGIDAGAPGHGLRDLGARGLADRQGACVPETEPIPADEEAEVRSTRSAST